MPYRHQTPSFLPDPTQHLLLSAALLEGQPALEAWGQWRREHRIETADSGSQRMAPLLYHNLHHNGWSGPEMPLLKGTLRKAWAHNERLAHMVAPLAQAWQGLGVKAALLKGAALATKYYPHPGTRPMDDLDILVPPERVNEAMAAFREDAWTSAKGHPVPRRLSDETIRRKRTQRLANGRGLELELHWFLLDENRWPGADDAIWQRAKPVRIRGAGAFVPGPEHLLLHVLVHGAQWNAVPPIRWVADSWMILRATADAFDWDLLLAEVLSRRVTLPVRTCLRYLRETMGADIPARAVEILDAEKPSRAECAEFRILDLPKAERPPARVLWLRHLRIQRLTSSGSWLTRLATLPDSLRILWRLDRRWKVPIAATAFLLGERAGAHVLLLLRRKNRRGRRAAP